MKFDLIPHSAALNSYELLSDVIAAIDDEPKRFNWGSWLDTSGDGNPEAPACGTFACIAGWTNLLTATSPNDADSDAWGSAGAERWFPEVGAVQTDLSQLFYANYANGGTKHCPTPQFMDRGRNETQRQYADRGIASIRAFMAAHREALLTHSIVIPARAASGVR